MVVSFDNVFYTHVLKELESLIKTEFAGRKIYIGPVKDNDSSEFSIRIWGLTSELDEQYAGLEGWRRNYTSEIVMYSSSNNANELFYEQYFRDTERLQQILYDNTVITGSNNLAWFEGNVNEMIVGEDEDLEDENIIITRFEFSCRINRHS